MPYYAIDAANILEQCKDDLEQVIRLDSLSNRQPRSFLLELKNVLDLIERNLNRYLQYVLRRLESKRYLLNGGSLRPIDNASSTSQVIKLVQLYSSGEYKSIDSNDKKLELEPSYRKRRSRSVRNKGVVDSLLFRLIVRLQLLLVQIDDARLVVSGKRKDTPSRRSKLFYISVGTSVSFVAFSGYTIVSRRFAKARKDTTFDRINTTACISGVVGLSVAYLVRKRFNELWMRSKIDESIKVLSDWLEQWILLRENKRESSEAESSSHHVSPQSSNTSDINLQQLFNKSVLKDMHYHIPGSMASFFPSTGEWRFLILKKAMDVIYASLGTSMSLDSADAHTETADWQLPLSTAAAASYYSLTGASTKVSQVTSSSKSAQALLQRAWGMVSTPSVKDFSLSASKLLKGAAFADRIYIAGVPCFVLSSESAPELTVRRSSIQRKALLNMKTINESEEYIEEQPVLPATQFAKSDGSSRQRNVILHLTGGGFFAHIIASDLPYLMDWSRSTGAIVVCPEYALLPDHAFPDALNQVYEVYRELKSNCVESNLGFEVNRLIVTGESTGGNLAASLHIRLISSNMERADKTCDKAIETPKSELGLPDALMLSCPILDMTLVPTFSRMVETSDPVLPCGLISAISDAYVPAHLGVCKKDPLVSPVYASDYVLSQFPPTLIFTSSNDPISDDSVAFNGRLRECGVESELRAAHNVPHAYLGLGTAGFPEAQQVQAECEAWLCKQLLA